VNIAVTAWALAVLGSSIPIDAQPLRGFDEYVAKAVKEWEVPGLAIAVVKDGAMVFAEGYGVRELGKSDPVDVRTLFAIGSTTKAMTAAALGMLVDEKKIEWDDAVIEHLPNFQLYDPVATRELTIRDLLTHRGGLGNADFLWYGQESSPADILHRLRYLRPAYSLRSSFIYQNLMYAAAGEVVASVSGTPWKDFIGSRVFTHLGMSRTVATAANLSEQPNVASPHYRIDGEVQVIENASVDAIAPAGSVWSGVDDMSKWMLLLLEGGKGPNGRALLSTEALDELFTSQTIVGLGQFYPTAELTQPHWTTYGLGWFQHDYEGRAVDFHTGSIDGMVAIIGLIRDERLGVCVLSNLDHAEVRHALMYRVFDLYGNGTGRDWSTDLLALYTGLQEEAEARRLKVEEERVADTSPSLSLERYSGLYEDPLHGKVVVSYKDGLRLRYGPGLDGILEHWHYDTFRVHWDATWRGNAFASFVLDRNGEPGSLELRGARFQRTEKDTPQD